MKFLAAVAIGCAALANANIYFPKVQPTCDVTATGFQGCLRGQVCLQNNTCAAAQLVSRADPACSTTVAFREDNRCGPDFNGAPCSPNDPYGGGCCSTSGWCGKTDDYCLPQNCQCGCAGDSPAPAPSPTGGNADPPPADPPASTVNSEPIIGPQSTAGGAAATGAPTTDGSCGANFGGTTCVGWPQGECCSMYGYCGKTAAHCGDGCQSGPCVNPPIQPAPSAKPAPMNANPGSIKQVGDSGVPAMHAGLLPNGRVVFLDKVENYTHANIDAEHYAYSSEYDPATNKFVPLAYKTNAFCAGGSFLADGTILSIGGNAPLTWLDDTVGDGFRAVRYLKRSSRDASLNGQAWNEPGNQLDTARWYPSAQTMPDGRIFVASGSLNGLDPTVQTNNNPTYEILSPQGVTQGGSISMPLLVEAQPYYMYPFMHLLNDGTLFVFVSKSSEIFNVGTGQTVKTFPDLPGDYRTYPNTGGSVLLPLSSQNGWAPDIVICGGGAYQDITSPTDPSCGRIQPLSTNAGWEMDAMPEGRGMVEGTLLPDGTVLWVNGCGTGAQGFELAVNPTLEVLIYDPAAALGQRWSTGPSSAIPRLYHSVALLLLDGTLMITGSNPWEMPNTDPGPDGYQFPTEFTVEIYTPPYLSGDNANRRPTNIQISSLTLKANKSTFAIQFTVPAGAKGVEVSLYHGGFVTHSLHMSHRMAFLDNTGFHAGVTAQTITVTMPPNSNVAPPGPYVVYVVVDGVPGIGQFVMVS